MSDLLVSKERVARKQHTCFYCGGTIEKGETYAWSKTACDGELSEWTLHNKCDFVANKLWSYIEPDPEGMTDEDFREGCAQFYTSFICPETSDKKARSHNYHVNEIYAFLQENDLKKVASPRDWMKQWACIPKEVAE